MKGGGRIAATINRSVRFKVMAIVLLTTLSALLVSTLALLAYEADNYSEFLISDAATQADILARVTTPALQFNDQAAAQENIALLAGRRDILGAAVYTPDGEVFARYARGDAEQSWPVFSAQNDMRLRPEGSARMRDGSLELFHPILASGERIGTVYVRSSYDLTSRLRDHLLILGLVMLLSLGVAGVFSVFLQRGITAPVLAVTDVARRVLEQRDFRLRATKTTQDEIGLLVDSFNAMLAEVGRTTEELELSNQQLSRETDERRSAEAALRLADQRKNDFLATLAHELRNPLAPMLSALHLIELAPAGRHAENARQIMRRQLDHMVRLIDDLLDVSRITQGKFGIQMQIVELVAVIESAIDTARPPIEAHGHTLSVELPEQPVHLRADPVRLSQVFSNLLNNAANYTDPGGRIELTAEILPGRVRVVVADNGIGMSTETRATVFDMFSQAAVVAEHARQAGLGVGLGLSRRLIELHGGTIEAHSAGIGQGSEFSVELQTTDAPAVVAGAPEGSNSAETTSAPNSLRVLLVDDNVDFAVTMAILLEGLGHQVAVAHDGAQAIERAARLQPDIAFLDIGLPDMDGHALAGHLRALPTGEHLVLVAVSGWGQEEDRARSRETGFARHLVKPAGLERIQSAMALVEGAGSQRT